MNLKEKENEISGIAAYAATQHPAFHVHIIDCCTSMAQNDEDYEGFRNGFHSKPDIVAAAGNLQLQFQPNATPDAVRIKGVLTSLLSAVNDDRSKEIITILKAEILHREQLNATDGRPSGLKLPSPVTG